MPLQDRIVGAVRYRATLAYDGTNYCGFQRQAAGIPTIQGEVEEALAAVTGQTVTVIGAGRTDTGVHAAGQVIAFEVVWKHSADALLNAINAVLPDDIALQDVVALGERAFHPRFDAVSRLYRYTIYVSVQRDPLLRQRAWQVYRPLALDAMRQAASLLPGVHDFGAFGQPPQGENTVHARTSVREVLRSEWTTEDRLLIYRIEANAFLQHMVRRVVGMLVTVGRGAMTPDEFEAIFRSGQIAPGATLAPPQGLVLERVKYPGE